ncbi:hypothetical protein [Branchiibius cervicis]|uniref:Tat pathway signal sequence domain protein n=1 Tax=Branchiibius cervicis TaxID=908252 RepID=A0ABW2AW42_9MICO
MVDDDVPQHGSGVRPISRRTLAKGAAWTTPVLVAGSVVPAQAASAPATPCQCLVGYSRGSDWTRTDNTYTFDMNVLNSNCGLLSLFFSVVNADDPTAAYSVTYTDSTAATVNGSTAGNLLAIGTITGTLTVPAGKTVSRFCVAIDVSYRFILSSTVRTCTLQLCWGLTNPTASSGSLVVG